MKGLTPVTVALAGLAAGFVSASVTPSRRQESEPYVSFFLIDVVQPGGNGLESCTNERCETGTWKSEEGFSFFLCSTGDPSEIGFRRTGDDSSSVIFKCNDTLEPYTFHLGSNHFELDLESDHHLVLEWPNNAVTKRDLSFEPFVFETSQLTIINSGCDSGFAIQGTVVDGNGVKSNIDAVDHVRVPIPNAFPATFDVIATDADEGFVNTAEVIVSGEDSKQLSAFFGGDNGPTITKSHDLNLVICPD